MSIQIEVQHREKEAKKKDQELREVLDHQGRLRSNNNRIWISDWEMALKPI